MQIHELSTLIDQAGGMRNLGSPMPVMDGQIANELKRIGPPEARIVSVPGKHYMACLDKKTNALFYDKIRREAVA